MTGKKFHFSLASVLKLRKHEAEQSRLALAQAIQKREAQEQKIEAARATLRDAVDQRPTSGRFDPAALRQREGYVQDAQQALNQALGRLKHLQDEEAKALTHFHERRQAEESLEILYDDELARHQFTQHQQETLFLDEQAVIGFARKKQQQAI